MPVFGGLDRDVWHARARTGFGGACAVGTDELRKRLMYAVEVKKLCF